MEGCVKIAIVTLFLLGALDDRILLASIFLFAIYFPYKIYKVTHENKS